MNTWRYAVLHFLLAAVSRSNNSICFIYSWKHRTFDSIEPCIFIFCVFESIKHLWRTHCLISRSSDPCKWHTRCSYSWSFVPALLQPEMRAITRTLSRTVTAHWESVPTQHNTFSKALWEQPSNLLLLSESWRKFRESLKISPWCKYKCLFQINRINRKLIQQLTFVSKAQTSVCWWGRRKSQEFNNFFQIQNVETLLLSLSCCWNIQSSTPTCSVH